jgi:NAD(P)-dependent dehydrogenase (short-subunit alcohol dehydrogenase family)
MTQTYPFTVSSDEFKGKRVLVTGGTKGMGEAIVRRFLLSGAVVATTARAPLPQGQRANRRTKSLTPSDAVGPASTVFTVTFVPSVVSASPREMASSAVFVIP